MQKETACIKSALIIAKQTLKAFVEGSNNDELKKILLDKDHPEGSKVHVSNLEHIETLEIITKTLAELGLHYREVEREPGEQIGNFCEDIIISIGGDGTFLDTSHSIQTEIPILGVNSAPSSSIGHYCLTNRASFKSTMESILTGELMPAPLTRLKLTLDGAVLPVSSLNEVMVAGMSPADTSRYEIELNGLSLEHKSSGLIISTAPGSTGFNLSAGGQILPITSKTCSYTTLAPYLPPGQSRQLVRGLMKPGEHIIVRSKMLEGCIYVDGKHIRFPFKRGSTLTVGSNASPIFAYVNENCHDGYEPYQG